MTTAIRTRKERTDHRPPVGLFARTVEGEQITYTIRGATSWYQVTLLANGRAECQDTEHNVPCPGFHYQGHCRHVDAARSREESLDPEYEAWKQANGLDKPLSREAYRQEFKPNEW